VNEVEANAALEGGDFLRAWVATAIAKCPSTAHRELLMRIAACLVEKLQFVEHLEWFWSQD
jgi:DNA helicase-2/ATP-dependent DNA helicase PcrA